jgi:neutral amino acid transport system ATP-binding protein
MPADTTAAQQTPQPGTGSDSVARARAALADVEHEPGAKKPDPIIVADGIVRKFGGLTAVDVHHVEVQRGVITALIGPNGAGKTTFFNLLTGFDRPDSGDWSFNGTSLNKVAAFKVARMGMVRTFQLTKVLSKLTVIENMRVGATGQKGETLLGAMFKPMWRSQEDANTERADSLLERFLLIKKREDFAGSLSGGQRKLLEMARALMADPELVMLDEPMAGVNPALKQSLLGHVKSLRDDGRTVLFVEHDMDMVRDISDWVIVMAQGKIIAEGPPDSVMGDQRVIDAYLGAHHDTALSFEEEEKILAQADAELAAVRGEELPAESVAPAQPAAPAGSAAPAEPDAAAEPAAPTETADETEDKGARHE